MTMFLTIIVRTRLFIEMVRKNEALSFPVGFRIDSCFIVFFHNINMLQGSALLLIEFLNYNLKRSIIMRLKHTKINI